MSQSDETDSQAMASIQSRESIEPTSQPEASIAVDNQSDTELDTITSHIEKSMADSDLMEGNDDCVASDICSLDDEGLRDHYDAIILGTGLTESILAAAISRTGRLVLHMDQNEYYGRNEASHYLESFLEVAGKGLADDVSQNDDTELSGGVSIKFQTNLHVPRFRTIALKRPEVIEAAKRTQEESKSAENDATKIDIPDENGVIEGSEIATEASEPVDSKESMMQTTEEVIVSAENKVDDDTKADEEETVRPNIYKLSPFNIDFPGNGLLLGSGIVVDCLIKSDVSKYLEFQSMEGLYFIKEPSSSEAPVISTVPRSRGEVFKSDLLSVLEKRSLMKFLQFVSDWGREREGIRSTCLNEKDLAQGRSLHRPQNKDSSISAPDGAVDFDKYHQKSFQQTLSDYNLSSKLQEIIYHSLCLYSRPISSAENSISSYQGLSDLYSHIVSLGRFGDGAFLAPTFGLGDISQAFCRMSAVWAGVYILRRCISSVTIQNEEIAKTDVEIIENKPRRSLRKNLMVIDSTGRQYSCTDFICHADDYVNPCIESKPSISSNRDILTYTAIFDMPLLPTARSVGIIPPKTSGFNNTSNIFIIQKDSTTLTTPPGYYSISILMEIQYPSSLSKSERDCLDGDNVDLVSKVVQYLLKDSDISHELCSAITIRPLYEEQYLEEVNDMKNHIWVTGQTICGVSMGSYVQQAEKIFSKMYPGEEFLKAYMTVDTGDDDGNQRFDMDEEYDFSRLEKALNEIGNEKNGPDAVPLGEAAVAVDPTASANNPQHKSSADMADSSDSSSDDDN